MSRGRAPILQPPGVKSLTSPASASNGPNINTDERIAHARCGGISVTVGVPLTDISRPDLDTVTPSAVSTLVISSTSLIAGQSQTVTLSLVIMLAASMGRTAFLAPCNSTLPESGFPPVMRNICFLSYTPPKQSPVPHTYPMPFAYFGLPRFRNAEAQKTVSKTFRRNNATPKAKPRPRQDRQPAKCRPR